MRSNDIILTRKEAEEYCTYKRQKKIAEIMSAMRQSESILSSAESAIRLCERASRLHQPAVRMTPTEITGRGEVFRGAPVKIDCIIGGNGETFAKVKEYEVKKAIRAGARELTLVWTPSYIVNGRYTELRKELRRIRRAAGKLTLKVRVEQAYPRATLSRLARICSELGANYFSLPYFVGCESLQAELSRGCALELSGIETLADFKKTVGAGTRRVLTKHAWELYNEWMKEVESITVEQKPPVLEKPTEKPTENGGKIEKTPLPAPVAVKPTATAAQAAPAEAKALPPVVARLAPTTSPILPDTTEKLS